MHSRPRLFARRQLIELVKTIGSTVEQSEKPRYRKLDRSRAGSERHLSGKTTFNAIISSGVVRPWPINTGWTDGYSGTRQFLIGPQPPSVAGRQFVRMKARTLCWILVGMGWLHAQAVLSRRDYAEHGRTFTQIWMADAGTNFRQLTHSVRDHSQPICSRDGHVIYFVSDPDVERSRNSYGDYHSGEREVWAYDRQTGQERFIWRTSRDLGLDLSGMTANGGALVSVGTELRSLAQNPWVIGNVDEAAVSPDGRNLALVIAGSYDQDGQSQNTNLFVVDAATGQLRTAVGKYDMPTWSPDGTRIAAFSNRGLAILDATGRQEIERVALPMSDAPPQDIVFAPERLRYNPRTYRKQGRQTSWSGSSDGLSSFPFPQLCRCVVIGVGAVLENANRAGQFR
jgi:hypothetical protein